MKKVYITIAAIFTLAAANAKTYTVGSGKWSDASVWGGQYIGSTIKAEDEVIITGQVTMNTSIVVEGTLKVEKGAGIVGNKDLVVAKSGKFVNNGNTVVKRIVNAGTISNNMIMEAMMDITNQSTIENNNNMVAGNNFDNFGGNASGNGGAYFVNNNISSSPSAKFGSDVKVFYGNIIESQNASASDLNLDATVKSNEVVLSVSNPTKMNVAAYSIEKSTDGKNFQLVEMVNGASMTYTDNKVDNNLTYYRVKAINTTGEETTLPLATVKAAK